MLKATVVLAALGGAYSLKVAVPGLDPLPAMYRNRWAGDLQPRQPPMGVPTPIDQDAPDESNTACVTVFDKQLQMKRQVCGELSFDSTDDGMSCVEDPLHPNKWICK